MTVPTPTAFTTDGTRRRRRIAGARQTTLGRRTRRWRGMKCAPARPERADGVAPRPSAVPCLPLIAALNDDRPGMTGMGGQIRIQVRIQVRAATDPAAVNMRAAHMHGAAAHAHTATAHTHATAAATKMNAATPATEASTTTSTTQRRCARPPPPRPPPMLATAPTTETAAASSASATVAKQRERPIAAALVAIFHMIRGPCRGQMRESQRRVARSVPAEPKLATLQCTHHYSTVHAPVDMWVS